MKSDESPQITMLCTANEEEESVSVYENEPLVFSVDIVNDAAVDAASYNYPLEEQREELQRKFDEKQMKEEEFKSAVEEIEGRMVKARIYRFGGPTGWPHFIKFQVQSDGTWTDVKWPLKLLKYHPADQVVNLDASTSCYVEFGLDPQGAQRPKGEFRVKAVVEIVKGEIIESNVITVNLLKQKVPEAEMNKEENLLARGNYAYKRGLYEDAIEYVHRILKTNPHSLQSLILLGDIEERRKDLSAALSAYEKALEEFYKQNPDVPEQEPPRYIISKINMLRASMKRQTD